jgi:hypothetical protein
MCRIGRIGLLVVVIGCQSRLDFQRAMRVDTSSIHTFDISPPRYDQPVKITLSTTAPLKVDVFLRKDTDEVEKDLTRTGASARVLAHWSGDGNGSIDVTLPAHQPAVVRLEAEKKSADVAFNVTAK